MIDLLVIHPGAQHGIYGKLGDELTALEPPTWARMVAGYVRDRGFSVRIIDAEAERLSPDEVASRAQEIYPRLIAIVVSGHQPSASTQQMIGAGEIARKLNERNPGRGGHPFPPWYIVMLGNHPSALPEMTLREEAVDYVIDGEGPVSLVALLKEMNDHPNTWNLHLDSIPGLVYKLGGPDKIICNPIAPLIDDLDRDLHGDVWDLLPMDRYRAHQWQVLGTPDARQPYASIYTSLNCPHACSFCMISVMFHDHKYRRFSPKSIVDRIVHLYNEHDVRTLKFADEMFVLNRSHVTEICNGLIASGIANDLNWWCYGRVDSIFPDLLDLMRQAGCRWIALGIESASPEVRDGANKRLRNSDIVGVVREIQSHNIHVIGNFMFGLRDDTVKTMNQTLDLALDCLPDWANFYSCHAYPGSALYTQAITEGWTLPQTFSGYSQHNQWTRPLDTAHISGATVLQFRDEAFRRFFQDEFYRSRILSKFGQTAIIEIDRMLEYQLSRKLLTGEIK